MSTAVLFQQIFHVFKKFHMSTLVTGYSNALHIFLNSRFYNFFYRPVMTQVNNFSALALHDTAHNINGSIMTIKQGSGGDDSYFINRGITHKSSSIKAEQI